MCDLLSLFFVLFITYLSICLAIIFLYDSDILTFLAVHFGKSPESEYAGKVVWITGASSGIGEAMAKELAKSNAKVVLSARRKDELERVKKECQALNPKLKDDDILVLPLDMLDYAAHKPALQKIISHFGKLNVLVNNAGRSQRAYWEATDIRVDKDLFELNVFSLVNLTRVVLKHFFANGGGQIGVVSSVAGKIGVPNSGTYTGSKHALQGYFEGLRMETFHRNVQVTLLCPGPVFSGVLKNAFTDTPGKETNEDMKSTDRRLTSERCGYLCVVAMANKLNESWQGLLPVIPSLYIFAYLPYLGQWVARVMGPKAFQKIRDGRDTLKKE